MSLVAANRIGSVEGCAAGALVIEDDRSAAELFRRTLQLAGFEVTVTSSGSEGIRAARQRQFAGILLDIRLPDLNGLNVLRTLSAERNEARIVVLSGYLTVKLAVEAIRLGACEVLEKPVDVDQLVAAVAGFTSAESDAAVEPMEPDRGFVVAPIEEPDGHSIAHRWAKDIVKGCLGSRDSKTLTTWARLAGTSITMICQRCEMLEIKPHDARDLMRALYAMLGGDEHRCEPHVLLDISDRRTLQAFRRKAGPGFQPTRDLGAISRFLESQRFVDPNNYGVTVLRSLLVQVSDQQTSSRDR